MELRCLPLDRNRPKGERKLLDWITPYLTMATKEHFQMVFVDKNTSEASHQTSSEMFLSESIQLPLPEISQLSQPTFCVTIATTDQLLTSPFVIQLGAVMFISSLFATIDCVQQFSCETHILCTDKLGSSYHCNHILCDSFVYQLYFIRQCYFPNVWCCDTVIE